jgi:hypothetical protein
VCLKFKNKKYKRKTKMGEQFPDTGPSHEDLQHAVKAAKEAVEQSGSTTMHVQLKDTEMLGTSGANVGWEKHDPSITSELNVATSDQGKTSYEATATPPVGLEGPQGKTKIERRDAQGNIVYEFVAENPKLARQVGIVASEAVKESADSLKEIKESRGELPKAA